MRILIVEDEIKTAELVRTAMETDGFSVEISHTGEDALSKTASLAFDALVLDIMLPGIDGLALLKKLRTSGVITPILLFSARGEVSERIEGLNLGADDYLPKPFVLAELVARVRALCRRNLESKITVLKIADLTLDTVSRRAQRGGKVFDLTAREFRLLEFLMRSSGQICGRRSILQNVFDFDFTHGTNLVEVYIRRLREKIDEGFEPKLVQTVRGVGYGLKETP